MAIDRTTRSEIQEEGREGPTNLALGDVGELVVFLHEMISKRGRTVTVVGGMDVMEVEGRFFFVGTESTTVGGPFPSIKALLRSQGRRRYAELATHEAKEALFEVVEWRTRFFAIGPEVAEVPKDYSDLTTALLEGKLTRVIHPDARAVTTSSMTDPEAVQVLRRPLGPWPGTITLNMNPIELEPAG
ncbi:hypothetical protein ACFL0I_01080 [Gemmatimonadota bacterium]